MGLWFWPCGSFITWSCYVHLPLKGGIMNLSISSWQKHFSTSPSHNPSILATMNLNCLNSNAASSCCKKTFEIWIKIENISIREKDWNYGLGMNNNICVRVRPSRYNSETKRYKTTLQRYIWITKFTRTVKDLCVRHSG